MPPAGNADGDPATWEGLCLPWRSVSSAARLAACRAFQIILVSWRGAEQPPSLEGLEQWAGVTAGFSLPECQEDRGPNPPASCTRVIEGTDAGPAFQWEHWLTHGRGNSR